MSSLRRKPFMAGVRLYTATPSLPLLARTLWQVLDRTGNECRIRCGTGPIGYTHKQGSESLASKRETLLTRGLRDECATGRPSLRCLLYLRKGGCLRARQEYPQSRRYPSRGKRPPLLQRPVGGSEYYCSDTTRHTLTRSQLRASASLERQPANIENYAPSGRAHALVALETAGLVGGQRPGETFRWDPSVGEQGGKT